MPDTPHVYISRAPTGWLEGGQVRTKKDLIEVFFLAIIEDWS
jgi:hypothetical protein